ncbi:glycoside hydrolase family 38 C-terminal domain-containing protein [Listeria aquatica]|uniref:glycoside hydrolase family 38 N-terminal domain-containing protein n=1 Tax=Listeria aquatica TaxID=1494960 RepID=UPI0031F5C5CB
MVSHSHWDREWYFTTMDALLLSDNLFSDVLSELEKNSEAKFCLDGQSSIVDGYLELHPEKLETIQKLVKKKQLAIGPWYTQTDAFFVGEESFLRNLAIGIRDSRRYGEEMKIGYLPDTFGFNAQMPTLLQNCGIDNIVFWRGLNLATQVQSPYFIWKGLGEKKIIAANLVDGYGTAAFLNDSDDYLEERLLPALKRIEKWTDNENLLLPSGGDQLEIIPNLPETLNRINKKVDYYLFQSSYEAFLETLRNQTDLPEYQGEFREPCTTRAHKSIGSVRYDIKRLNYLIEQKLTKRVEPLLAIAKAHEIELSTELLIKTWKKLLEGHAHDSMGGCVSDDVAKDILHRMKEADELASGFENYLAKRLSEKLGLNANQVIVFNTTSKAFRGYKIIDFLASDKMIRFKGEREAVILNEIYFEGKDNLLLETPEGPKYINEDPYYRLFALANIEIPAMGFKVLEIEKAENPLSELEAVSEKEIKNKYYRIQETKTGLLLKTSEGTEIENFLAFEDTGNNGDTYDFSPLENEKSTLLGLKVDAVKKSELVEIMYLSGNFQLPKDLAARCGETEETGELKMKLEMELRQDSSVIRCKLIVQNEILSHRLRVVIRTEVENRNTMASLPFGFIGRENLQGELKDWHKKYVEYPIDLEPFDKSVSVYDEEKTITAFGKGIKEYQFQQSKLYLTLFASTSQLGKPNLLYRPGRASGDTTKKGHIMMPTPLAELLGELEFEFAFSVQKGTFDSSVVSEEQQEYVDESMCYQNQMLNKFIHRLDNKIQTHQKAEETIQEFSLLQSESEAWDSTFMPSLYDQNAFILRLKNPTERVLSIGSLDTSKFSKVCFVNVQEQPLQEQQEIAPYDFVSIKLWL